MSNTVSKNMTAKIGEKYGYKYTDLAQVNKALFEMGITYYQYIENYNGADYIMTVPIINGEEQPPRRGCKLVDAELRGVSNPVQEYGSAITYCRRYSLLMCMGLATEDNDAQGFSKPKELKATPNQLKKIRELYTNEQSITKYFKVDRLEDLTIENANEVISAKQNG